MSPTIAIPLGSRLLNQCRKPNGWLGRFVLRRMNRRHSKLTDWGLTHVSIRSDDAILDIGCGGGKTVAKLASLAANGKVYGVDFSEESVAVSRRTNQELIRAGRIEIRQASVSELPLANDAFDLVTAVETHYYWPDLSADVRETLRVVKPGGAFIMIAESYKGGKYDRFLQHMEALERRGIMKYALLTVAEHRDLLSNAGYSDVAVFEEYDKGWVCAVGRKR
jgi:ubiquinone/menaquinone biosynthesis C-methylase UbiE